MQARCLPPFYVHMVGEVLEEELAYCTHYSTHHSLTTLLTARLTARLTALPTTLQVMEEKLDVNNVEVAAVKLPPPPAGLNDAVTAACHYVPGHKVNKPKFTPYSKAELEAVLARVTPAPAN